MDSRTFLGLEQTHNPFRWHLPIQRKLCTGGNFLYGGAGLGAAISAMEGTTGRKLVWSTAQYLSYARPGEVMDIDVIVPVVGNAITQARVVAHVGEREILVVNAALGDRDFPHSGQWETAPPAPPPSECPEYAHRWTTEESIHDFMLERTVRVRTEAELDGTQNDGRTVMWARLPSIIDGVDAATLGVLGDFVPAASARRPGSGREATCSTTRCASSTWCPRSGCSSTSRRTGWPGASVTAWSTCSPRTAR